MPAAAASVLSSKSRMTNRKTRVPSPHFSGSGRGGGGPNPKMAAQRGHDHGAPSKHRDLGGQCRRAPSGFAQTRTDAEDEIRGRSATRPTPLPIWVGHDPDPASWSSPAGRDRASAAMGPCRIASPTDSVRPEEAQASPKRRLGQSEDSVGGAVRRERLEQPRIRRPSCRRPRHHIGLPPAPLHPGARAGSRFRPRGQRRGSRVIVSGSGMRRKTKAREGHHPPAALEGEDVKVTGTMPIVSR
jgi:hypothetical protein